MSEQQPTRWSPNPLEDLFDALLWPRLLRVPALAARPQRVLLALFLVAGVGWLGRLPMPWHADDKAPFLEAVVAAKLNALFQVFNGIESLHLGAIETGLTELLYQVPRMAVLDYPVSSVVLGLPMLFLAAVLGGAICRSVACEFCQEITHPWPRQLGFAIARWKMFVGALFIPTLVIGAIGLLLALGGPVFFNGLPLLEVVGALLYGIGLFLALVAVVVLVLTLIGWPMLLPAAACEGSDAIDAVQRTFAYVVARPLRLVVYLVISMVIAALAVAVLLAIATAADAFAQAAMKAWTSPEGAAEITGAYAAGSAVDENAEPLELGSVASFAAEVVGFWGSLLLLLVTAYAVSAVHTAGTLVYLFMRQVCDGQHHADLWTPGQIESQIEAGIAADAPPSADDQPTTT